jgi:hypothetical protein
MPYLGIARHIPDIADFMAESDDLANSSFWMPGNSFQGDFQTFTQEIESYTKISRIIGAHATKISSSVHREVNVVSFVHTKSAWRVF